MKSIGKAGLLAIAALAASGVGVAQQASQYVFRGYGKFANDNASRSVKRYPQMVVDRAEIAQWNRNVQTRQVLRHAARHA